MILLASAGSARAQPPPHPLTLLDVPFISQSEALCGGAAAAMVLRFWGERGLNADSFAHLVDRSAAGIRTAALISDLQQRGWAAAAIEGSDDAIARELTRGRPVLALVEDRPGTFHYVVIVAAHERAIVFHDPARSPFRVMTRTEFRRRWDAADRWMAIVVPGKAPAASAETSASPLELPASASQCDQWVADGVRHAQANDLDAAERSLTGALSCPGPAAFRELAGVRFLQRRWGDVAALAAAAVEEDAADGHAWRLLATSRFLQNDARGALTAWNAVGEPRLDLLRVDGLTRTRQRPVETLIGVPLGTVLTADDLVRSARRLRELPSAVSTGLTYVPVPSGLAELRATVAERPLFPSGVSSYAVLAVSAAARQQVDISIGALAGGGERVSVSWRFWRNRPLYGIEVAAPAPWGGVWSVDAFAERQPFDTAIPDRNRTAARMTLANWATSRLRWSVRGGVDRWDGHGALGMVGGAVRVASHDDRVEAQFDADLWTGSESFGIGRVETRLHSSAAREGPRVVGRAGAGWSSTRTPADLWFTGDTGHARPLLLRAHPALDDGYLRVEQLGRRAVYGSGEVQHWWRAPAAARFGVAAFVDAARISGRFDRSARPDVDAGAGVRLAAPGIAGVFRLDVAKGLRDGATAVSFVYEP